MTATDPVLQGTAPRLLRRRNAEGFVGMKCVFGEKGGGIQGKAGMSGFGRVETGNTKLRR